MLDLFLSLNLLLPVKKVASKVGGGFKGEGTYIYTPVADSC